MMADDDRNRTETGLKMTTIARTYRIGRETVQRLDDLAGEFDLHRSSVVDALLSAALDDLAAGRLILRRRVVRWEIEGLERKGI